MRRSLRFVALLAVTAIAASLAASPSKAQGTQDPARLAAARELMEASGGIGMAKSVVDKMRTGMLSQIRQKDPSAAAVVEPVLRSILSPDSPKVKAYFKEITEIMTQFYAERFTLEELRKITAFQSSPVGQKFQKVLPEAMGHIDPAVMKFQMSIMSEVQGGIKRTMEARRK